MSKLSDQDAQLKEVLSRPRYPCDGKSCLNCKNMVIDKGDNSVGLPDAAICELAKRDLFPEYEILQGYVETLIKRTLTSFEMKMGKSCPHYSPVMLIEGWGGLCPISKEPLPNTPSHLHKWWVGTTHGDGYPVLGLLEKDKGEQLERESAQREAEANTEIERIFWEY
jgi:hypothetical protein